MLWKIFLWINILIEILAILGILGMNTNLIEILEVLDFGVAIIAVYAFIYSKKIFSRSFWKAFFWFNVVYDIAYLLYAIAPNDVLIRNLSFLASGMVVPKLLALVSGAFDIPMLYAIYQLSKPQSNSKKKKSH